MLGLICMLAIFGWLLPACLMFEPVMNRPVVSDFWIYLMLLVAFLPAITFCLFEELYLRKKIFNYYYWELNGKTREQKKAIIKQYAEWSLRHPDNPRLLEYHRRIVWAARWYTTVWPSLNPHKNLNNSGYSRAKSRAKNKTAHQSNSRRFLQLTATA